MRKFIETVPKVGTNNQGRVCWLPNKVQSEISEEICENAMLKTEAQFKKDCYGCTGSLTIREAKIRSVRWQS